MSYLLDPPTRHKLQADVVVYDRNDEIIAIADVKTTFRDEEVALKQLSKYLSAAGPYASFGLLCDTETIQFFAWRDGKLGQRLAYLSTKNILSFYAPDFSEKQIYDFYLATLLVSWLRDLIYHWKTDAPPEYAEMERISFTAALSGGFVFTDVTL